MILTVADIGSHIAAALLAQQPLYSAEQRALAMSHPHLIWVIAPGRQLPAALRDRVWRQHGPRCAYCPETLTEQTMTIDHIVPIAKGGTDAEHNLTVACRRCNSSKGAR